MADAGPPLTPLRCPTKKRILRHPSDADHYLQSMLGKEHASRQEKMQVYHCRLCGWFHMGHLFPKTARRGKHKRQSPL